MNISVESLEMLINRLSSIEESLSKVGKFPEGVCPCWINAISFHENGTIKEVKFFQNSRSMCTFCNPNQ